MAIAVVWGNKQKRTAVGFVADYCVICRELRPFSVQQLTMVSHVYWIPTGAAKPVARVGTCLTCGVSMPADTNLYSGFATDFDADLHRLVGATNPSAYQLRDDRRRLEAAVRQRTTPSLTRMRLISEPFQLLAPVVESLYATDRRAARTPRLSEIAMIFSPVHVIETGTPTGTLSPGATWCLLATIFVAIGLFVAGGLAADGGKAMPWWSYTGAVLALVLGIASIAKFQAAYRGRVLRSRVLPRLANSLRCFEPTLDEIRETMAGYAANGFRIGTAFRAEDVWAIASGGTSE